ncbi:hypothetical protein ACFQX6_53620 [Streptosporangium lutulentum]
MACFTVRGNAAASLAAGAEDAPDGPETSAVVPEVLEEQAVRPRESTAPAMPTARARNTLI